MSEKKEAAPQPTPVKRTPLEWARLLGATVPRRIQHETIEDPVHPFHAAADVLHGWSADAHHNQGERTFRLTEDDYRAALDAAAQYPCVPPHKPAIAPSCPHDHSKFRCKRASGVKHTRSNWRPTTIEVT